MSLAGHDRPGNEKAGLSLPVIPGMKAFDEANALLVACPYP
jgi:hypothetical protein